MTLAVLVLGLTTLTDPHVRSIAPEIRTLIAEGQRRSETFHARAARLEASDLVVYVEYDYGPSALVDGFVSFMGTSNGWRYVRIRIRWDLPKTRQLAILAHELQHAVEIADAPEVVDSPSLALLYTRIGSARDLFRCRTYDTAAAVDVQRRVFGELRGGSPRLAGPLEDNLHGRRHAVVETLPPDGIQ